jgi:hypothetical protein
VRPCAEECTHGLSTAVAVAIRCVEFSGRCKVRGIVFELGWGGEVDCEFYPFTEAGAVDCCCCGGGGGR